MDQILTLTNLREQLKAYIVEVVYINKDRNHNSNNNIKNTRYKNRAKRREEGDLENNVID